MKGKKNGLGHKKSESERKSMSERTKVRNLGNKYATGNKNSVGNRWVNDGINSKKIKAGETIPCGFVLGRLMNWVKRDPTTGGLV